MAEGWEPLNGTSSFLKSSAFQESLKHISFNLPANTESSEAPIPEASGEGEEGGDLRCCIVDALPVNPRTLRQARGRLGEPIEPSPKLSLPNTTVSNCAHPDPDWYDDDDELVASNRPSGCDN